MPSLFQDSPEYLQRLRTPFKPSKVTLKEIQAAVPNHLYRKSTLKGFFYIARDIACLLAVYQLGLRIDPFSNWLSQRLDGHIAAQVVKWSLWATYWHWQGVIFAGLWCLAHEAGHGNISQYSWINHACGFALHTFVLAPYYAWRSSHRAHHQAAMSVERDENYVPRTRSDYKLPSEKTATLRDYHEIFEETPLYTLFHMMFMQLLGWQIYLFTDVMGSPRHPAGTNHFMPSSALFKPHERNGIIASDIGITLMSCVLYVWTQQVGLANFLKLYFVPYILCNHWIVMLTYLHHSDPSIAHYRRKEWNFVRGALSTVDRPLLGWAGRFFFHNVSHDHIAHHLFSYIPFYNQPQVTEIIKKVLKEDYNYDSTNTFRALWRTFTECCFIEDEGDIVFYKNRHGQATRELAEDAISMATETDTKED
ncbi:hypothetical protein AMATHDRAFT_65424 [Amanita thiersii Skay4041]|uniref:Fatty acid desaturase domain-containing protein n=1 Tax=Amanita thiersii Skay4041 TaxID=703135 RepID=A0A2A9NCU3_9AGAR|nr:hypothetical protein AMATHDRAFT_65424 [Amanita thiersii Skay4041]